MEDAIGAGAQIIQHKPGYNGVIISRARADAAALGWREVPFGMEGPEAVPLTSAQTANFPLAAKRIVIAVGIGMSLSGVLHGLARQGLSRDVLAVAVGAPKPEKYINRWAPADWRRRTQLIRSEQDYSRHVDAEVAGISLDPVYEAKAAKFLQPGDCFWIVGRRGIVNV